MNKAILKFINFLENEAINLERDFIKESLLIGTINKTKLDEITKKILECRNISRQLKVPEKDYSLHGEVFVDFDILSLYMVQAKLTVKEVEKIILTFCLKNIATGICEIESNAFDPKEIDNYPFKTATPEEIHKLIHEDRYRLLLSKEKEERTPKENALIEELEAYTLSHPSDVSYYKEIHHLINKHYLTKVDTYTKEDLDIFIEQLKKLKLSDLYLSLLYNYLLSKIDKRKNTNIIETTPPASIKPHKIELSRKEVNTLYRELSIYYDIEQGEPKRYLNIKEIIYCLSIMYKLNFNEESILKFLKNTEKYNRQQKVNPIAQYIELYNKLIYYKDRLGLSEDLTNIESIIEDMFIVNDEDYVEWKMLLADELAKVLRKISNNYEYEIKSLSK